MVLPPALGRLLTTKYASELQPTHHARHFLVAKPPFEVSGRMEDMGIAPGLSGIPPFYVASPMRGFDETSREVCGIPRFVANAERLWTSAALVPHQCRTNSTCATPRENTNYFQDLTPQYHYYVRQQ